MEEPTPSDDELLAWKPRLGPLSVEEKLEQAELLKRKANLLVARGEPKRALRVYATVFAYVNGLSVQGDAMAQYAGGSVGMSATAEQGEHIQTLKTAVWSNMALCCLKLDEDPQKVVGYCDRVLELDPTHSKARFRKAQALVLLSHFERAHVLLTVLLDEEPKNAAVRGEMRRLQQQKRSYDAEAKAREKSVFGNMFK